MPVPRSTPHPHVRENPRYFLLRQMNVDGEFRLPGDEVPEASSWPNLHTYLDLGWIEAKEHRDVENEVGEKVADKIVDEEEATPPRQARSRKSAVMVDRVMEPEMDVG